MSQYTIVKCKECQKPVKRFHLEYIEGDPFLCSYCNEKLSKEADMSMKTWIISKGLEKILKITESQIIKEEYLHV
jgi:DNA-directed RNA polymerase subunit RPC12/RpoP